MPEPKSYTAGEDVAISHNTRLSEVALYTAL